MKRTPDILPGPEKKKMNPFRAPAHVFGDKLYTGIHLDFDKDEVTQATAENRTVFFADVPRSKPRHIWKPVLGGGDHLELVWGRVLGF